MKLIVRNKEPGLSMVVFAMGLIGILGFAALAVDFGISNNIQNELQKATTTAALAGALYMEPNPNSGAINETLVKNETLKAFRQAADSNPIISSAVLVDSVTLGTSKSNVNFIQTIPASRAVRLQTRVLANTYFLALLGISSLQVNAQAAAFACPAYPARNLPAPSGSIIASDIKDPVGGLANLFKLAAPDPEAGYIFGSPDNIPVALGPGGSVTLQLPAPIVDAPGAEIYVKELGDLEGYYLYIGQAKGAGNIEWTNISCLGEPPPELTGGTAPGAYVGDDTQYKYYGSGYFDIAATCTGAGQNYDGSIKNATHLRIVDDNAENGILSSDLDHTTVLIGEHSSNSPGADIDTVGILHHSRLIDYNAKDTDGDGLVDPCETILGTNINAADTDGDGLSDGDEVSGQSGFVTNPRVADSDGDGSDDSDELTGADPYNNPLVAASDQS